MEAGVFVDTAEVMSKGQVIIPKDVCSALGASTGDKVTFLVEGSNVRMVNAATYAMQTFQQRMAGEAMSSGITSPDDVTDLVSSLRSNG